MNGAGPADDVTVDRNHAHPGAIDPLLILLFFAATNRRIRKDVKKLTKLFVPIRFDDFLCGSPIYFAN